MVRSAAALVALLILPSFVLAQEPVGTHTVVDDDTLWDLAQAYYQNPFEWRVIWEANRDSIADPNLIYPGEIFVIPGLPGTRPEVVADATPGPVDVGPTDPGVEPEAEPQPQPGATPAGETDLVQFGFRQARPAEQVRTIFYTDTASQRAGVVRARDLPYAVVTRDAVYSAPWLVRIGEEPSSTGSIEGFAREDARASTIRSFERVRVSMPSPARVGAELQAFRVTRTIESVGEVVTPTGVLTVTNIAGDGVIAVVTKEYGRIQPGDLVRPVPAYNVQVGQMPREVAGGSEAMVMGFAGRQEINDLGHMAFLDLGADDGINIGDEFILYAADIADNEGSLQVVGVTPTMATARILSLVDDVFHQGVVVRLARTMR